MGEVIMEFIIGAILGLLLLLILGLIVVGFKTDNVEYLFSSVALCIVLLMISGLIHRISTENALKEKCILTGHKVIKIEESSYCKL
jgi:NhaP-type Na+/H+ or K+/H+ antiporter